MNNYTDRNLVNETTFSLWKSAGTALAAILRSIPRVGNRPRNGSGQAAGVRRERCHAEATAQLQSARFLR